jgi:hypothetical protein
VIQETGFYLLEATWIWESTSPAVSAYIDIKLDGASFTSLLRVPSTPATQGSVSGGRIVSLTAGDLLTMTCNPIAVNGVTARGNASPHLSSALAIARLG